ncbi:MAG: hypothetical protein QW728_02365, partial [Thermoplasmata archaeon]
METQTDEPKLKMSYRTIDISAGTNINIALMNEEDAKKLGLRPGSRVNMEFEGSDKKSFICQVDLTSDETLCRKGELLLFKDTIELLQKRQLAAKQDGAVLVKRVMLPRSFQTIHKKVYGQILDKSEIEQFIKDAMGGHTSRLELGVMITAIQNRGLDFREMVDFTRAMANSGRQLQYTDTKKRPILNIYDKHSTGG